MPDYNPPFDHNELFRGRGFDDYYPDQMRERPDTELKVRIRLNQSDIPTQLTTELLSKHNMDLSRSTSNKDIVIVSGVRPDNIFGEHEIMEIVREHAPNAEVV